MIAEVQQSSDTTYRLFDWNRVGPDGKPRPMHINQALDVIDFHQGPVDPVRPVSIERSEVRPTCGVRQVRARSLFGVHGSAYGRWVRPLPYLAGARRGSRSGWRSERTPLENWQDAASTAAGSGRPVKLSPQGSGTVLLDAYLP